MAAQPATPRALADCRVLDSFKLPTTLTELERAAISAVARVEGVARVAAPRTRVVCDDLALAACVQECNVDARHGNQHIGELLFVIRGMQERLRDLGEHVGCAVLARRREARRIQILHVCIIDTVDLSV